MSNTRVMVTMQFAILAIAFIIPPQHKKGIAISTWNSGLVPPPFPHANGPPMPMALPSRNKKHGPPC